MTNNNNGYDTSKASWLARGLEQLLDTGGGDIPSYDVVIVGSGYGGAIAASTLAGHQVDGQPIKVCVLERGNEYLPGMFPTGLTELPTYFRMGQNKEGLFDARPGPEVTTLVANGVGGGSLINAGVMEVPLADVFQRGWPTDLSVLADLKTFYDQARDILGAGATEDNLNTIADHPDGIPVKTQAIEALATDDAPFRHAAITVAMTDSPSYGQVNLNKCVRCGDCATGCNFGAKISLDVGLLAHAQRRGVEIFSGATVLDVRKDGEDWVVRTVFTNGTLRKRLQEESGPAEIRAKKVILAAGTLGSTEILKRSTSLNVSDQLGERCSTNGDMLVTDYATRDIVNSIANENVKPSDRAIGPTITGVIDMRDREEHGVLIEEMSVPAGIRRVFTEIFTTTSALHRLNEADHSTHENGFPNNDIYAARHRKIDKTALYAVMGDDGAEGTIEVKGKEEADGTITYDPNEDGIGRIVWPGVQEKELFKKQVKRVTKLARGTKGDIIANPVWNLLPEEMSFLLDNKYGPVITVHPLGGCAMADDVADGVVDNLGRVYDADEGATFHDGLVVLDGSIIPTALGTNPALTIAAVALRAVKRLVIEWDYQSTDAAPPPPIDRPVARDTDFANEPEGTTDIQVCERMYGRADIRDEDDRVHECVVELTMRFEETPVSRLTYPDEAHPAEMALDTTQDGAVSASRIRIYNREDWQIFRRTHVADRAMEDHLDDLAIFRAPLESGTLSVFQRRKSNQFSRFFQAGPAYLKNRGWRDLWQSIADPSAGGGMLRRAWQRFIGFFRVSSRAGEKRWLRYELLIGEPEVGSSLALRGNEIVGRKRFTYRRRANPWRQLMRMRLRRFPGLQDEGPRTLELDLQYLVRIGIPLIRITRQADGVTALAELGSFLMYLVRFLLGIHIWSFRRPDWDPEPANVTQLPWKPNTGWVFSHIPQNVTYGPFEIDLGPEKPHGAEVPDEVPGKARLMLFERPGAVHPPVVMLHGYSASGTTFAHESVPDGLAQQLWESGRDVWVADLRTSAGMMDTATQPWAMEQIGYRDIPEVINYIHNHYGGGNQQIDVLAHCMGSVMFSMGVLMNQAQINSLPYTAAQRQLLTDMPGHIRKVAFTQVGPLIVFSPANRFRAYAVRYFSNLLPGDYQFVPPDPPSLEDQLLDRILATLPYPDREWDRENPTTPWKRTPWTRTRHRMDALYGRDFNAVNVDDTMLKHIDSHFGPLSTKTITQTMHFARYNTITDATGYNSFVSRELLASDRWGFPVFSVHGSDNGLSDVTTVSRMKLVLDDAGCPYDYEIVEDAGHQDALIGDGKDETAQHLINYFNAAPDAQGQADDSLIALTPWIGPIYTSDNDPDAPRVRIGARPSLRAPEAFAVLRVQIVDGELRRHDDGMPFDAGDEDFVMNNMLAYPSSEFESNRWVSFPMPIPPAVPSSGDGLLVLVLYAEARVLPGSEGIFHSAQINPQGDLEVVAINPATWKPSVRGDPTLPSDPPVLEPVLNLNDMRRIAQAVLTTLRDQQGPSGGSQLVAEPVPTLPAVDDPSGSDVTPID